MAKEQQYIQQLTDLGVYDPAFDGAIHVLCIQERELSRASPAQMLAVAEDVMGHTGGIGLYSWGIHVDKRSGYARWNG